MDYTYTYDNGILTGAYQWTQADIVAAVTRRGYAATSAAAKEIISTPGQVTLEVPRSKMLPMPEDKVWETGATTEAALDGSNGGISTNEDLTNYVDSNFPGRLPDNADVTWQTWDKDYGLTHSENLYNPNANITVSIPSTLLNNPNILYDCVDHEIVHVNDLASGRVFDWYIDNHSNMGVVRAIMDYKAYNQNLWYNNTYRNGLNSTYYSNKINEASRLLPPNW